MQKYTFRQFIIDVLGSSSQPLTFMEIWESGVKMGLDKKLGSIGKTPWHNISALLYTDIKNEDSLFYITSKQPTTFYLKNKVILTQSIQLQKEHPAKHTKENIKERSLHPLLVKFLYENPNFNLYCKTIFHEKSTKSISGRDKWNYPDIVGVHFPFENDYEQETLSLLKNTNQFNFKFYAFELKVRLSWSNLKESYFQAVSNSSFANEGYLVVFEEFDDEILEELIRLNASFGIGVIRLESNTIDSNIILPSHKRELDIATLNMLVEKNPNFKEFIQTINEDLEIGKRHRISKNRYDTILDDEAMQRHIEVNKLNNI
ncbi:MULTISPECIES: HTH domain-containing protein [Helicobacter]|uniref:HTH domain-containing protein n=1 Tax=Helicobacter ibis TaxID=2962633 RepID=A0ABT4VD65_9HELI|nr:MULTISPECIES: HTH domain-containing protein [Helicobacter]MDA3967292.1 HTH domain-containing protein [Helicobacter sp. WB40]MDA3968640.1 HTH domain-containing protein [Helicobacter ibis]